MTVLLAIAALGTFLIGYLAVRRLDLFLERGSFLDTPQGRANEGVLVYGAPDVVYKIKKSGLKCRTLLSPTFPADGFYSALFALSGDDNKNLAICRAAQCADPGIYIIARCNAPEMRIFFEATGARQLLEAGESLDILLAELWGVDR
ncbi:MAG TPA: hypothetical protein VN626_09385 [Clostridia bacterium]|nr:hypothetical protein [Clostridia bacterium]